MLGRAAGAQQDSRDSEEWVLSHARWPEGAETGLCLIQEIWEHLLPQARGAAAGASARQRCSGAVVLFQGLFLEPRENTLTVWWKEEAETREDEGGRGG